MKVFILTFFFSSITALSICMGLITAIDPYDKLGNNLFRFATKAVAQSRENKFYMFESSQKKYEAFILGSSAAHRYPTLKVEELTGLKTFNYAVQHSTPIDYLAIIRHILSKSKPKLVLLQLDFSTLDSTYKVDNRLFNSPLNEYIKEQKSPKQFFTNDNFTLRALRDSLRVIYVNKFGKARHIYLSDGNYIEEKVTKKKVKIKQGNNLNFTFDYTRLKILRDIQKICNHNQIRLITFAAPVSNGHFKKIQNTPHLREMYSKYLTELSNSLDNFIETKELNSEKYNSYFYFHDSVHPTKKMSEIILNSLLK